MTHSTGHVPSGLPPRWQVWSPQRLGDFRWSIIPVNWFESNDPTIDAILSFVLMPLWVVEFILIRPTVGVFRLAIHHARSPGWYVESRYGSSLVRPNDPRVQFQTRTKRQARRLGRVLQRELRNGADFNAPAIQAAIARNKATFRPVAPPPAT